MLFNKYILVVISLLILASSVSASPQFGGIGDSNGISLNGITPKEINVETEGKWFVEKRTISKFKILPESIKINRIN